MEDVKKLNPSAVKIQSHTNIEGEDREGEGKQQTNTAELNNSKKECPSGQKNPLERRRKTGTQIN